MSYNCTNRIITLKQGIESVTGESYTNLTEAVQALKNGYRLNVGDFGIISFNTANITDFERLCIKNRFKNLLDNLNTSNGTNFFGMFEFSNELTVIPRLDTSKGTNFIQMFNQCSKLNTITQLDISNSESCNFMFGYNSSLTTINFTGTIPVSISFEYSPLSVESMKNIISHLVNYSGTEHEFSNTLTFSSACWEALEADSTSPDGGTWADYVDSLGWLT